jgi:hypothetical protein
LVSFTPRLLYPRGESLSYSLKGQLGGIELLSERFGEEINVTTYWERNNNSWKFQLVANSW